MLRFAVSDSGIGIPQEKINTIFDAFSQADSSTTREYGGTEIGLTICRRLVAAMGGAITATSEVGVGTTFIVEVPCEVIEGRSTPYAASGSGSIALLLPEGPTRAAIEAAGRDLDLKTVVIDPDESGDIPDAVVAILADGEKVAPTRRRFARSIPAFAIGRFGDTSAARLEYGGEIASVLSWPVSTREVVDMLSRSLGLRDGRQPAISTVREERDPGRFAGVRVLAADDSAINREVLTEALTRLQVTVVSVENGQEAKDLVARESFDLVFMDASMPVLDGFQATRAIREAEVAEGRTPVPIVALTAHVVGSRAHEWRDAGMVDCVTKPFTLAAIETCLRKWVPMDRLDASKRRVATDGATVEAGGTPKPGPTPASTSAPADRLPTLDPDVLQSIAELAGPANDLTKRLVKLFQQHAPIAMERLRTAMDGGEATAIALAAHAFKSMCRNIGAVALGQLLHEVEEAAAIHGGETSAETIDGLDRSLAATLVAVDRLEGGSHSESTVAAA